MHAFLHLDEHHRYAGERLFFDLLVERRHDLMKRRTRQYLKPDRKRQPGNAAASFDARDLCRTLESKQASYLLLLECGSASPPPK